jgi:hypothetical protein
MGCCTPERECGSRFFQEFDVTANQQLNVMSIHSDCGKGFIEFWSPYAYVEWTVRQQVDGFSEIQKFRTGPASRAGIYLVNGGELTCNIYQTIGGVVDINEYNGNILNGIGPGTAPKIFAKFKNCSSERAWVDSQRMINTPFDRGAIPGGANQDVAFVPHYAKTAVVSCDTNAVVRVVDGVSGVVRQARNVLATPGAFPFNLTAWEKLTVAAGNDPCDISILWSETIDVYN